MLTTVLVLAACAPEPPTDTAACLEIEGVGWANYGDIFFRDWCRSCHSEQSPNRYGAPDGLDFDTLEQVRDGATSINRSIIETRTMPFGGGPTDAEREKASLYILCGAPT